MGLGVGLELGDGAGAGGGAGKNRWLEVLSQACAFGKVMLS